MSVSRRLRGSTVTKRVTIPKLDGQIMERVADRDTAWFVSQTRQPGGPLVDNDYPTLICGQCGGISDMTAHEVAPDGTVTPSILCDCGWHVWGKLEGWNE